MGPRKLLENNSKEETLEGVGGVEEDRKGGKREIDMHERTIRAKLGICVGELETSCLFIYYSFYY